MRLVSQRQHLLNNIKSAYLCRFTRQRPKINLFHSKASFRTFGTGHGAFLFAAPKLTFFRLILTGGATTFGYISYKINSKQNTFKLLFLLIFLQDFSDWLKDSIEVLGLEGTAIISGVSGVWGGFAKEFSDLLGGIETKKTPGTIKEATEITEHVNIIQNSEYADTGHNDFNDFIRKMIQIKEILRVSGNEEAINLPNIVVIGSQSSGKSSVLESIVGHEFLPKGQNMVTRRPLELTLVYSPQESDDSVIIAQYDRNLKLKDFTKVQAILKDLNSAVPENDWISFEPIRVTIYSPKVPDLTLVDLPGYIQVTNKTQPPALRDKIRILCDKYIQNNNLILAVCAADVDLANSEALKASRKYDPKGERTIGVITKLDLVEAKYAASLVSNEDYPLMLGYIGVVCKPPDSIQLEQQQQHPSIISRITGGRLGKEEDPKIVFERQYFDQNKEFYAKIHDRIGLVALRNLLTTSLEGIMSRSLSYVVKKVTDDLDELKYQLKAQYNDRFVSPEAYVSNLISSLKKDFSQLSRQFTRNQVDKSLREYFNQKLVQICDENIWCPQNQDSDGFKRLNSCLNSFTRSGVGRFTANLISDKILEEIEVILNKPPFTFHLELKSKIFNAAEVFLKRKCQAAMEQVENSMKPYKQGIEFTPRDWKESRNRLLKLFDAEEIRLKEELKELKEEIGIKRLKKAVEHLKQTNTNEEILNNSTLIKAKEVVYKTNLLKRLTERKQILKTVEELESVKDYKHQTAIWTRISSIFGNNHAQNGDDNVLVYEPSNDSNSLNDLTIFKDPCQAKYPEIYLFLVMDRFLKTCSTFVHYELVSEFLQPFPDNVISADPVAIEGQGGILSLTKMTAEQLKTLLRENPEIAAHLDMQEKYRALEEALRNLKQMKNLKKD
jgi:dynamin-like GTPase MGM1, mitochondrial